MSVSRPARCLISNSPVPQMRSRPRCRTFHTSLPLSERRKPKFANVKASDMGLVRSRPPPEQVYKPYTEAEKAVLAKKYTPAQIKAIEAGEKAVRPEDLDKYGVIRTDFGRISYLDDFGRYKTTIDSRPRYDGPIDPQERVMTEDEINMLDNSFGINDDRHHVANSLLDPNDPDYEKKLRPHRGELYASLQSIPITKGTKGVAPWGYVGASALAPSIPRTFKEGSDEVRESATKAEETEDEEKKDQEDEKAEDDLQDPDGVFNLLRRQTGYSLDDIQEFNVKILVKHRVVNQTRLGKIDSLYCLAIAGDRNGRLGIGQAKGKEAENTQNLARIAAIRNLRPVPRYEERTIFGEVKAKVSAVEVSLMSRPPGFGLRCQHLIFEMARAAGIQDLAARVPRSRNKMNTVKATYQALMSQRLPSDVAMGRGKKMVDVRKVYYGGRV